MGFDEGDRVRLNAAGLIATNAMKSKRGRLGTVHRDPVSADRVIVKWDGTKAPSGQFFYHEDWLEHAEEETHEQS